MNIRRRKKLEIDDTGRIGLRVHVSDGSYGRHLTADGPPYPTITLHGVR